MNRSSRPGLICILFATLSLLLGLAGPALAEVRLPAIIGDNMVLQRELPLPIWGWASPGEKVTVRLLDQRPQAVADEAGRWRVTLAPLQAGGPLEMIVSGSSTIVLHNILAGEVWVCSGQSNMQMSVRGCLNWEKEVAQADYPQMRLFVTPSTVAARPAADVLGGSSASSRSRSRGSRPPRIFSARAAQAAQGARRADRIGLGRHVDPDVDELRRAAGRSQLAAGAEKMLKGLQDYDRQLAAYETQRLQFEKAHPHQDPGNTGFAQGWAAAGADTSQWKEMKLPATWQSNPELRFNGIIWGRKEIDLPPAWAGQDLRLSLGPLDDFDTTYFNNVKVGGVGPETPWYWCTAADLHRARPAGSRGKECAGGAYRRSRRRGRVRGMRDQLLIAPAALAKVEPVRLAGMWKYRVEHRFPQKPVPESPYPPMAGPMTPASLFNAKIAGLIPFGVRGAIWYQGEANAGEGYKYRSYLTNLIEDWHRKWARPGSRS